MDDLKDTTRDDQTPAGTAVPASPCCGAGGGGCCAARDAEAPTALSAPGEEASARGVRTVRVLPRGHHRLTLCLAGEHHLAVGDRVVISGPGGKQVAEVRELPRPLPLGKGDFPRILRKAAPDDISRDEENRKLEEEALAAAAARSAELSLPMELVRADYSFDRSRVVFSFTAEKRVDFRELVRDLARRLHCRIEMRQVGIRDEARMLGGIGPCGMTYCCTSFLTEFAPISVKMAKDQNVILNPGKISGGCGRLLCCLGYEYRTYEEFARSLPRVGKKVELAGRGKVKVRGWDIFKQTITVELPEGDVVTMPVEEFRGGLAK